MSTEQKRAKRRYLIIPLALFAIVFAGYSALWVYGKGIMEDEIAKYIANEESMGRSITYEKMRVAGYPYNLRAKIDNFVWEAPGEWRWSGERLNIVTLPYDPSRLILAPRKAQKLVVEGKTYDVEAKAINVSLADDSYAAEAKTLNATGTEGDLTLEDLRANWDAADDGGWVFVAGIRKASYTDPDERTLRLPYMNMAITQAANELNKVTIDGIEGAIAAGAESKPALITAKGTMGLDAQMRPEGQLNVEARNIASLFDILEDYGAVTAQQAAQARATFSTGAAADSTIPLPLTFRNGEVRVGPMKITDVGPINF